MGDEIQWFGKTQTVGEQIRRGVVEERIARIRARRGHREQREQTHHECE